jgi:hypothetical protein
MCRGVMNVKGAEGEAHHSTSHKWLERKEIK